MMKILFINEVILNLIVYAIDRSVWNLISLITTITEWLGNIYGRITFIFRDKVWRVSHEHYDSPTSVI